MISVSLPRRSDGVASRVGGLCKRWLLMMGIVTQITGFAIPESRIKIIVFGSVNTVVYWIL